METRSSRTSVYNVLILKCPSLVLSLSLSPWLSHTVLNQLIRLQTKPQDGATVDTHTDVIVKTDTISQAAVLSMRGRVKGRKLIVFNGIGTGRH